jgi:hypothetical protein
MGPPVPGDIPWWQLSLWAEHHGMTRGEFAILDICIPAMDAVYRRWFLVHQKTVDSGVVGREEIG